MNRQVAFCKILKKLQDLLWYKRSVMESFIGCFLVDFAHCLLKQLFVNCCLWTFLLLFLSIWSQCSISTPPEKSENLNEKKWMKLVIFCKVHQTRLKILRGEASVAVAYVFGKILSNLACCHVKYKLSFFSMLFKYLNWIIKNSN